MYLDLSKPYIRSSSYWGWIHRSDNWGVIHSSIQIHDKYKAFYVSNYSRPKLQWLLSCVWIEVDLRASVCRMPACPLFLNFLPLGGTTITRLWCLWPITIQFRDISLRNVPSLRMFNLCFYIYLKAFPVFNALETCRVYLLAINLGIIKFIKKICRVGFWKMRNL